MFRRVQPDRPGGSLSHSPADPEYPEGHWGAEDSVQFRGHRYQIGQDLYYFYHYEPRIQRTSRTARQFESNN